MKFPIKDFFSKCDQIRRKLRIWSHLLKKSVMKNFIFCAVVISNITIKAFLIRVVTSVRIFKLRVSTFFTLPSTPMKEQPFGMLFEALIITFYNISCHTCVCICWYRKNSNIHIVQFESKFIVFLGAKNLETYSLIHKNFRSIKYFF